MANQKISEMAPAGALDGTELIPVVRDGDNLNTTTQDIADLGGGGTGVQTIVAGTNVTVDSTDPLNPIVSASGGGGGGGSPGGTVGAIQLNDGIGGFSGVSGVGATPGWVMTFNGIGSDPSWQVAPGGGGGSPGGSNLQIQINSGGNFGAVPFGSLGDVLTDLGGVPGFFAPRQFTEALKRKRTVTDGAGSYNNWNPTGWGNAAGPNGDGCNWLAIANAGGTITVTGLSCSSINTTGISGHIITFLTNLSPTDNVVLVHASASSTAANRFSCPGGTNYTIGPLASVPIVYDADNSLWIVLGKA